MSFETFLREYEQANTAFVNGDASLWMPLVSRSEQTSIFGGFGGHEVGWSRVGPRYEWAAAQFRPSGAQVEFEYLEKHVSADTAYYVAIERCTVEYVHRPDPLPDVLRATMVFRKEAGGWKIVHRHADPLGPAAPPPGS
ncbi:YybH family protein [Kribbella sp. CA-247076]|uniref:YybH family protein n=1 Tax=Kribbella sp. CA-247076 TaxID=3239941 RepID=UPI003D90FB7F